MNLLTLLFSLVFTMAMAEDPFDVVCRDLLKAEPSLSDYSRFFTEEFQNAIPLEGLKQIFTGVYQEVGECTAQSVVLKAPNQYEMILTGSKKLSVRLSMVTDPASNRIAGLLVAGIHDPSFQIENWEDVGLALETLGDVGGQLGATLMTDDGSVHLAHQGNERFAIGSTFKLYVLGALERAIQAGLHKWEDVLAIKDAWKSLPSGILHNWPEGKELTLFDHALYMISISDNTATDHLLHFLGRETVEAMLAPMGNSQDFLPLLTTLEFFKLKWGVKPTHTQEYLQADTPKRRELLNALQQVPRSAVGSNGVPIDKPTLIRELEWFATPTETCRAMLWLGAQESPRLRQILATNVPLITRPSTPWAYAGYKGGSEAGVINMTYLLETRSGQRACLSMSWNDPDRPLSEMRFMDVVQKTLDKAPFLLQAP